MTKTRIEISTWGRIPEYMRAALEGYALRDDGFESSYEAVARSICRRTGLVWCGGPRSEGSACGGGRVTSHHYAGTLGSRCYGGGWTPEAEVWFSIEAEEEEEVYE